jgi:hypothetical protein
LALLRCSLRHLPVKSEENQENYVIAVISTDYRTYNLRNTSLEHLYPTKLIYETSNSAPFICFGDHDVTDVLCFCTDLVATFVREIHSSSYQITVMMRASSELFIF